MPLRQARIISLAVSRRLKALRSPPFGKNKLPSLQRLYNPTSRLLVLPCPCPGPFQSRQAVPVFLHAEHHAVQDAEVFLAVVCKVLTLCCVHHGRACFCLILGVVV